MKSGERESLKYCVFVDNEEPPNIILILSDAKTGGLANFSVKWGISEKTKAYYYSDFRNMKRVK